MHGAVESVRALVHEAAWRLDAGAAAEDAAEACASAFVEAAEQAMFVTPNGVQVLGGHGFMQDYPVEKWMREARALGLLRGGVDAAREDAGARARGRGAARSRSRSPARGPERGLPHRRRDRAAPRRASARSAPPRSARSASRPTASGARRRPIIRSSRSSCRSASAARAGPATSRRRGDAAARAAREGSARAALCQAEELAYWDRGVAVSFPGPGLGEPPVLSMGTPEQKRASSTASASPTARAGARSR